MVVLDFTEREFLGDTVAGEYLKGGLRKGERNFQ